MKNQDTEITSLSAIDHILKTFPDRVRWLVTPSNLSGRMAAIRALAESKKVSARSGETMVLRVYPFEYSPWEFVQTVEKGIVLLLDHLQDPQNFGAILRSAEALGIRCVIIPKDRSVVVTPAVYGASAGAVESIPVVMVTNLGDRILRLKEMGFWVVGADVDDKATSPWKVPTFEKIALVVGAEYEGISQRVKGLCDWICQIPLPGTMESLNVSTATAIVLYELGVRREGDPVRVSGPQ